MPVLDQLFGTWLGVLTLLTIGFVIGMGVFIFLYVLRQIRKQERTPCHGSLGAPRIPDRPALSWRTGPVRPY